MRFGPPTPVESGIMLLGCGSSGSSITYTPPLDAVSSKVMAAYGMNRLITGITESLRVRESGLSAESDIGTLATGAFDEAGFTTFIGANSGYARKVYDHVAANDAEQATAGAQPQVQLNLIGGKAAMVCNASSVVNVASLPFTSWANGFEFWCVIRPTAFGDGDRFFASAFNYNPGFFFKRGSTNIFGVYDLSTGYHNFNTTPAVDTDYLLRYFYHSGVWSLDVNGVTEAAAHTLTAPSSGSRSFHIGAGAAAGTYAVAAKIPVCLLFKEALTAGEASALTASLKTFYGIA